MHIYRDDVQKSSLVFVFLLQILGAARVQHSLQLRITPARIHLLQSHLQEAIRRRILGFFDELPYNLPGLGLGALEKNQFFLWALWYLNGIRANKT